MYFDKITNYLASYLVIVREAISRFEDLAAILLVISRPERSKAEGEFSSYFTYVKRTLGKGVKNKLSADYKWK